jgi:cation transport ATPase
MAMGNVWIPHSVSKWLEFLLSTPVVVWAGGIFFICAWRSVVNRSLNTFTLIALGVGSAYLYSVIGVLFPDLFPSSFREDGEIGLYFESSRSHHRVGSARSVTGSQGEESDGKNDQSTFGFSGKNSSSR